jgi:hypothetical protein
LFPRRCGQPAFSARVVLLAAAPSLLLATFFARDASAQSGTSLSIPVSIKYPSLSAQIEAAVPQSKEAMGARDWFDNDTIGVKYRLQRSPIQTEMQGNQFSLGTTVQYHVEACPRIRNLGNGYMCFPTVSCDSSMGVNVTGTIDPTHEWGLSLTIGSVTTTPAPCMINLQGFSTPVDGARWISPLAERWLRERLESVAARLSSAASFRSRAQTIWSALNKSIEFAQQPRMVAALNPVGASLENPSITDDGAVAWIFITFAPDVVLGSVHPRPASAGLPALQFQRAGLPSEPIKLVLPPEWVQQRLRETLGNVGDALSPRVSTSDQGVTAEIFAPVHGRALLIPRLDGDRLRVDIASFSLDGVPEPARAAAEASLRDTLAAAPPLSHPFANYLARVPPDTTVALDDRLSAVLHIDSLRAESVMTTTDGVIIRVAANATLSLEDRCSPPYEDDPTQFPPRRRKPGC